MSNPTRKHIERWRLLYSGEDEQPGMPEIFDFALRALDMRDEIAKAFDSNKRHMWGNGKFSVISKTSKALKKFDAGGES